MDSKFTVEERFQFMENYVELILNKESNSLIISGNSGLGKSYRVMALLKARENLEYFVVKGFATARALYDTLYLNRNKIIVFDDCDSILEDKIAVNILKGALDSYNERIISWLSKGGDKSIPNQFNFQGQVIFISNVPLVKLDKAMKSRALTIDVFMTQNEKTEAFIDLAYNDDFFPEMLVYIKLWIVQTLLSYDNNNENINFRTFEKAIKVYSLTGNEKAVHYIGQNA